MVKVQAFVGYSFTDEDKDVVTQLLEYFDALPRINFLVLLGLRLRR